MSLVAWSSSDKHTNITLSDNNLKTTISSSSNGIVRATQGKLTGKWYWEITINSVANVNISLGISNNTHAINSYLGNSIHGLGYVRDGNQIYANNSGSFYTSFISGDVIGIALDLDSRKISFFKNGSSAILDIKSNSIPSNLTGTIYPTISNSFGATGTGVATANFGATEFQYYIPEGFSPYDIDNASWLVKVKHLIKSSNKIQVLDGVSGTWTDTLLTEPLTKADFETHGMDSLSEITDEKLQLLEGDEFEIITWTDEEGEEKQAQFQGQQTEWSDEGKLFEITIGENEKIKNITALNVE